MKRKAIILGAGPVGLVAGLKLLKNGWDVCIYEKENIVGGMCRTWKWGDFLVDTGPHIYHTPDSNLSKYWEDEFGDLFLKGQFWCKNVQGKNYDEYWDYPISWESISHYPEQFKKNILNELESRNAEDKAKAKNYTEYIEAQVGPTLRKMFFSRYPEKIWGISTDEMTPDWAPKRLEFRQNITPFYHNQWNAVGKFGTGCIFERIKDGILELGGKFYFNYEVVNIIPENGTIKQINFSNHEPIKIGSDDTIISSLPITSTAKFLGYNSKLSFRGICSVYLAYNRASILPEGIHWLYYDSEKLYFNRITEPKKLSPFVGPKKQTYLTAEITFSKGDHIDSMDHDELMHAVVEQVETAGLSPKKKLFDISMNKENFVYPLQYTGYQEELARTNSIVSQYQQLYSVGTGGDFNYTDSQIVFHKAFDTVAILCNKDSSYTQVIRQTPKCDLNRSVVINDKTIGDGERAYIIAEAGMNHNGSVQLGKQLIDRAKETGCDAIKFQTFTAKSRISKKVKNANYAETVIGLEETLFDMFDRLAMSFEEQTILFEYAREKGIEVFSTPFDFESADFLNSVGVNVYKISSMDLVNLPLIDYVAKFGKPIILSSGMSTLGQIEEAIETVRQTGNPNLILLHCNSSYPATPEEMNLNVILTLKKSFKIPVGLSDHTFGLFVSHTAIAIGANVIERHFTLDRNLEGPDHILSSEPGELSELVLTSKRIPSILGNGIKRIQPNEYDTLNSQRKGLYAACDIKAGQKISEEMIAIKGPGGGLPPKYLGMVVGRVVTRDIEEDYPINWEVL